MRVPIAVLGGGVWGRVQGGGSLWKIQEKGKGGGEGGGWGRDRQRNRQVNAQALSKLPFSDLPFSFSPMHRSHETSRAVVSMQKNITSCTDKYVGNSFSEMLFFC